MKDKYARQRGLVFQDKIEQMTIAIQGNSSFLEPTILSLLFLNVGSFGGAIYLMNDEYFEKDYHSILIDQGEKCLVSEAIREGAKKFNEEINIVIGKPKQEVDFLIILDDSKPSDISYKKKLHIQLLEDGFIIDDKFHNISSFPRNSISTPITYLTAGILSQELLRHSNTIRPIQIIDKHVELKLILRSKDFSNYFETTNNKDIIEGKFGQESIRIKPISQSDNRKDEALCSVLLPESLLNQSIFSNLKIKVKDTNTPFQMIHFSMLNLYDLHDGTIIRNDTKINIPKKLESFNSVVMGAGALGSWILAILSQSEIDNLDLSILDMDDNIELHNLNRQVLYTEKDLGRAKVFAAEVKLQQLCKKESSIHVYPIELKENFINNLEDKIELDYTHPNKINENDGIDAVSKMEAMLSKDLQFSDCIFAAVDTKHGRWLLNNISDFLQITLINGGTDGLAGSVDIIASPTDYNFEKRYGVNFKNDKRSYSCDGGDLPILSIVTSSLITASLQTLAGILLKSNIEIPVNMYQIRESNNQIRGFKLRHKEKV